MIFKKADHILNTKGGLDGKIKKVDVLSKKSIVDKAKMKKTVDFMMHGKR